MSFVSTTTRTSIHPLKSFLRGTTTGLINHIPKKRSSCFNSSRGAQLLTTTTAHHQRNHHHHHIKGEEEDSINISSYPNFIQISSMITTILPTLLFVSTLILINAPSAEAFTLSDAIQAIESTVVDAGSLGPLLFIIFYALATVLLVPASALTIAAGFLFGPIFGTIIVSIASTTGAAMAFLVGRYLARPFITQKLASYNTRFAAVDSAIASQGMRIVLLLRLSPLFPFTLLNYALSLTSISFVEYTVASWLGMLPGTIAYVALGGAGKVAAESAAGFGGISPVQLVLYILGAASTLGVTVLISRVASKALNDVQQHTTDQDE